MTPKQEKALACLITQPTLKAAAAAAGIDYRTMRRYLDDADFLAEYRHISTELVADARMRGQQLLSPAMETLAEICSDTDAKATDRIAAARSILEWGIRLTEFSDIEERLEALERETYKRDN